MVVIPSSSIINEQNHQSQKNNKVDDSQDHSSSSHLLSPSTSTHDPHPLSIIYHDIVKDHLIDQIVGDISKSVQTYSHIASFYEHYSFVSCTEPNHVDEAIQGLDWVNVMHEELNNFTLKKVFELVERPNDYNVIGTKWVFSQQTQRRWFGG